MSKTYMIPKKYKYASVYLTSNERLSFVKNQIVILEKMPIDMLLQYSNKYAKIIDSNKQLDVGICITKSDILEFIQAVNMAKQELYKMKAIYSKGTRGENKVNEYLCNYEPFWKVIQNVNLKVHGENIENDFILIAPSGVYTLEVKNIGNRTEVLTFDEYGRTIRCDRRGKVIEQADILFQSNRHLSLLKQYFNSINVKGLKIQQLVIISSDIRVKNKSLLEVLGVNNIYPFIAQEKDVLSSEEINDIYKKIVNSMGDEIKYPVIDYSTVIQKNFKLIATAINELSKGM